MCAVADTTRRAARSTHARQGEAQGRAKRKSGEIEARCQRYDEVMSKDASSLSDPVIPKDASLSSMVKILENDVEEMERARARPRGFSERVLSSSPDFILAIAFFALGLTANIVASRVPDEWAFISALVGVVMLWVWGFAREAQSVREEAKNLARDARLTLMTRDFVVEALAERQQAVGR